MKLFGEQQRMRARRMTSTLTFSLISSFHPFSSAIILVVDDIVTFRNYTQAHNGSETASSAAALRESDLR